MVRPYDQNHVARNRLVSEGRTPDDSPSGAGREGEPSEANQCAAQSYRQLSACKDQDEPASLARHARPFGGLPCLYYDLALRVKTSIAVTRADRPRDVTGRTRDYDPVASSMEAEFRISNT